MKLFIIFLFNFKLNEDIIFKDKKREEKLSREPKKLPIFINKTVDFLGKIFRMENPINTKNDERDKELKATKRFTTRSSKKKLNI